MVGSNRAGGAIGGAADELRRDACKVMRRLALEAGAATLPYFRGEAELDAKVKDDASPVTAADRAADAVIVEGLDAAYGEVPIVTEERTETQSEDPGDFFFLIDPLDGTKEFLSGSGEFTVNIALIEQGAPTLGVVYAPALGRLFWTPDSDFAVEERIEQGSSVGQRHLWVASANNQALRVVASKSHRDPQTDAYIQRYQTSSLVGAGSSLKFCQIACGEADLYPRFGPTMAWDTAAAHAVLISAGGRVRAINSDGLPIAPLRYGPGFAERMFEAESRDGDVCERSEIGGSAYANPCFVAYAPSVALR